MYFPMNQEACNWSLLLSVVGFFRATNIISIKDYLQLILILRVLNYATYAETQ